MPYAIKFDQPPSGYSVTAARTGENVVVQTFEFTSMADGQHFVQRLEGFPNDLLARIPNQKIFPSQVDHLLAIIHADGAATAYINELIMKEKIRSCRPIKAGEHVFRDDIIEIVDVDLGVVIPPDAGFLYLFSRGWRKGLVYDFGPLGPDRKPRDFTCSAIMAQAHTFVTFYEKFALSDSDWDAMLKAKWFPFAGLPHSIVQESIHHIQAGWGLMDLVTSIIGELETRAPKFLESWRSHASFAPHVEILSCAIDRFLAKDYMSATALTYPRIEGILRTHHSVIAGPAKVTQCSLAKIAVADKQDLAMSLLLPERFEKYLTEVYFANFSPEDATIAVSRNSVGHGVASVDDFNQISAAIGLLIVQQLFYSLVRPQPTVASSTDGCDVHDQGVPENKSASTPSGVVTASASPAIAVQQ